MPKSDTPPERIVVRSRLKARTEELRAAAEKGEKDAAKTVAALTEPVVVESHAEAQAGETETPSAAAKQPAKHTTARR